MNHSDSQDLLISTIADAIRAHAAIPELDIDVDLERAYALQHRVTKLVSPTITGGIKVGVTQPQAQSFLGVDHALLGSLYADARLDSGAQVPFIQGRALELEFAVLVDREGRPQAVAPAIEVVYVNFERKTDMTPANLVIANLGADLIVVGDFLPWESLGGDVAAVLIREGEVVNEASMSEALGGPAAGLPWVCTEAQRRGYALSDRTLIMMGACGAVIPAEKGQYSANYGPMGSLEFTVA